MREFAPLKYNVSIGGSFFIGLFCGYDFQKGPVSKSVLEPFYILFVISYRYVLIVFLDRVVSSERTIDTRWYDCTVGKWVALDLTGTLK